MAEIQPISTYSSDQLCEYFKGHVQKPPWRPWLGAIDESVDISMDLGPVKIGKLKDIFRNLTNESRYQYAAWKWLQPNPPTLGLKDLSGLKKFAGLDHLDLAAFLPSLGAYCTEMRRQYPALKYWIQRRHSLIEYLLQPPLHVPEELRETEINLRHILIQVLSVFYQERFTEAVDLAKSLSALAMEAAARAAFSVFAIDVKSRCPLSANLMVPTTLADANGPGYVPTSTAAKNAARAAELWRETTAHRCLVIVAETAEAQHIGFWTPLVYGDKGNSLPGAPEAFQQMEGSAVFKEDLPPFAGFPAKVQAKWSAYMLNHFAEKMFVSLPLKVPTPTGGTIVPAVLNVNAQPPDEDGWKRAYHKQWLSIARDRVAPFTEVAYHAFRVEIAANNKIARPFSLDTGSPAWDSLPGFIERKLLPEGNHD